MSNGRNLFYCISLLFKATGEAVLPMVLSKEKSFLNGTLSNNLKTAELLPVYTPDTERLLV